MKKSIKYAGIAAATLLAVAPVAAPAVTSTTVQAVTGEEDGQPSQAGDVKADTPVYATQDAAKTSADAFFGQYADKNYTADSTTGDYTIPEYAGSYGTDLKDVTPAALFGDALLGDTLVNDAKDVSFGTNGKITSVQAYANGTLLPTVNDININLQNLHNAVTFNIGYSYTDTDNNISVTGTKKIVITPVAAAETAKTTSAAVSYTTPYDVEANTNVNALNLDSSLSSVSVKDQDGNELVGNTDQVASVKAGSLYATLKGADGTDTTATAIDTSKDSDYVKDSKLVAGKTLYQKITVTALKDSTLANYLNDNTLVNNGSYTINGTSYAVTNNGNVGTDKDGNTTITLVRAINVGSAEAADWTVEDVEGTVTTKNDSAYYTLNNDDNNTITNRALAANTPWVTDQKRTNSNGDVQYRVATGEWVDANDVTFAKPGDNNNTGSTTGAYTDTQSISGVVNLDTPGMVYFLYNDNGERITNRAVPGGSSWRTDTVAKNADGVTVYRVATNEWVQAATGLTYVAD